MPHEETISLHHRGGHRPFTHAKSWCSTRRAFKQRSNGANLGGPLSRGDKVPPPHAVPFSAAVPRSGATGSSKYGPGTGCKKRSSASRENMRSSRCVTILSSLVKLTAIRCTHEAGIAKKIESKVWLGLRYGWSTPGQERVNELTAEERAKPEYDQTKFFETRQKCFEMCSSS